MNDLVITLTAKPTEAAPASMPRKQLSRKTLETLREIGQFEPDVLYVVQADRHNPTSYCVSPDGIGALWYDTAEEALEQHGW